jgi:alpha-beta hydrolase superfamily lysophospholipase
MSKFTESESTFKAGDGTEIFYRSSVDKDAKKLLILIHGLGEHSGRYGHVVEYFNSRGFNVFANDHRGFGRSDGKRGGIYSFDEYLVDVEQLRKLATEQTEPETTVICGHSMGGLIAALYIEKYADQVTAGILSAPFLDMSVKVPIYKSLPGKLLSKIVPLFSMPSGLDQDAICKDPKVVEDYANDPLVHDKVTARWFTEALKAHVDVRNAVGKLAMPILMIHGEADRLVDVEISRSFYPLVPSKKKKLVTYPGLFHEIFHEPERQQVFDDISAWLDEVKI